MMDNVKFLFQIRDKAVADKDYKQFADTQIKDIPNASINGYISSGGMETELLKVVEDGELKKVAFVKENYDNHSAYLLYFLVNTVNGWKIYDIISSLH